MDAHYKNQGDFTESLTEIFVALAAKELILLSILKSSGGPADQVSQVHKKCVEFIKLADERLRINEYMWIVKGFFEIIQGALIYLHRLH